jgi:hypothetical protein
VLDLVRSLKPGQERCAAVIGVTLMRTGIVLRRSKKRFEMPRLPLHADHDLPILQPIDGRQRLNVTEFARSFHYQWQCGELVDWMSQKANFLELITRTPNSK